MQCVLAAVRVVCFLAAPALLSGIAQAATANTQAANAQASGTQASHTQDALTLADAWQATLQNDPTYKAAIAEREAGQTNRAMGRAGLLPQIGASLGRNRVRGTLESPGPFGTVNNTDLHYMSGVKEIHVNQTVFNWSRIAEYRLGHARADYSLAAFDTKAKDTSIRLLNRYFQTLLSYENVKLAQSKLEANEKQIVAAQRRYDGGEGTITDVQEATSHRDLSRAELIRAQDTLLVARRELQEMVGSSPVVLETLQSDFQTRPLNPADQAQWLAMAMTGNAEIRAAEQGVRITGQEIHRTFGGHLPTLDLVAARRNVTNETLSTRNQDSITTSVGVQINLPVFSGGLTSAQVSQARHNRDRATQELAATRERVAVEVTRQYHAVVSGAQRIAALVAAVESAGAALHAVERSFEAGTRSIIDILDAQDRYYLAQLDLVQARLEYVLARLMLAGAAGTLDAAAITNVSQTYFGPEKVVLDALLPVN